MLGIIMMLGLISTAAGTSCEEARLRCAYRTGCGNALQAYVMACSAILHEGPPNECPMECQRALIALMTSDDEGNDLMNCECTDEVCRESKERVEVCRPHVMEAVRNESVVSCEVAQWICAADPLCSTALEYYHRFCKSMFHGRKCSRRCKNSIAILRKQHKAAKLDTCKCNGKEDYNCPQIRTNMAKLCFNKEPNFTHIVPCPRDDGIPEVTTNFRDNNEQDNNIENVINSDRHSTFYANLSPRNYAIPPARILFVLAICLHLRHQR